MIETLPKEIEAPEGASISTQFSVNPLQTSANEPRKLVLIMPTSF